MVHLQVRVIFIQLIMKRKINIVCFLFVAAFLLSSCAGQYDKLLKSEDYELKYTKAKEYYDLKKYSKAAGLLENQTRVYFRGSPKEDSVLFLLAKSYFEDKDMYSASESFDQFRNTFPRSPFTEEANMLRIVCLYEQTWRYELNQKPTLVALAAIEEFRYMYPRSAFVEETKKMEEDLTQRLEEKDYEAAKLYYAMEDYRSANTTLKLALKNRPDTRYREEILYLLVISSYKYADNSMLIRQKDRFQTMLDEYYNFISEFPESKHRADADKMYASATAKIK